MRCLRSGWVGAAGAEAVAGVVSLLGLDESACGAWGVPAGLAGTVALVQALGDAGVGARLWAVSSGAVVDRAVVMWW